MSHWIPTEDDNRDAIRLLLLGVSTNAPMFELEEEAFHLHRKNNTFPGEVYMRLGTDALDLSGATREMPILYEGLIKTHLSDCKFRGRGRSRIQYAAHLSAALRGGLEPDMFDDEIWRYGDDYWRYALYAVVALIRASAAHSGVPVAQFAAELAHRHNIALH